MANQVWQLPTIMTTFAYGDEYFAELEGMLANIKEHHPNWRFVIGRGPTRGYELPTFEVESPVGATHWTIPRALDLDGRRGSDWDFDRVCLMAGWWVARVWHEFAHLSGTNCYRLLYSDVGNRFNGPLDVELEQGAEVVASPWWHEADYFDGKGMLCTCLLLFQGSKEGAVERVIDKWEKKSLDNLGYSPQAGPSGKYSDEELLTDVLHERTETKGDYSLLKLDRHKYSCWPIEGLTFNEKTESIEERRLIRRGLVDQWHFSSKMKLADGSRVQWPPPEEFRLRAPIGSFLKW